MSVPLFSRRTLLGMAASLPAIGHAAPQHGLAAAAQGVNPVLVARALDALARHNSLVWSRDVIGIADFGLPSATPRLHLVNILTGTTTSLRVAHGRGSDPDHLAQKSQQQGDRAI